jgi:hypothetical protein
MPTIDLKQLERKAFTATFQDGLWDIFIAAMALGFVITAFVNRILQSDFWSAASVLPLHILVLVGVFLGKRYLTAPRLGSVKFAPARVRKMTRLGWLALVLLTLTAVVGFLVAQGLLDRRVYHGIFATGLVLLVGFGAMGLILGVIRFAFYGILLFAAFVGGETLWNLGWPPAMFAHGWPLTFGIAGAIILVTGLTNLVRFLQSNPLPVKDTEHEPDR